MSYRADKLGVDAHTRTHTQTEAGNDNTRRPKLASGKNGCCLVFNVLLFRASPSGENSPLENKGWFKSTGLTPTHLDPQPYRICLGVVTVLDMNNSPDIDKGESTSHSDLFSFTLDWLYRNKNQ